MPPLGTLEKRAIAGMVAACCLPAAAAAQDSGTPQRVDPQTIVVTGTGLSDAPSDPAYSTQVIDRKQLQTAASGRIEDALSSVAGFQQFRRSDSRSSNPSAQGATLRALGGNATSRALVLLDGVPMSDPFFGYVPFAAIAPDRLAMVRVTRGGGSGPFGAGALAGTIDLASAGLDQLDEFSGKLLVNERGETETNAALAAPLGAGFATVSGRWDRGKGFYTTPQDQRVPATARAAYDSWSVQLRGVAPLSETIELQARGLIYRDERTLRFDGADSTSEAQDASLRLVGRGKWQFDVVGYVQARNFSNVVISSTRFVPVLDQRNTPSTGIGGKVELRPPVGEEHVLRLGADYRRSDGELFETALSPSSGKVTARRNAGGVNADLGLFVEDSWRQSVLTLTAGARVDRYSIQDGFFHEVDGNGAVASDDNFADRSGWQASFRGGARMEVAPGVSLRSAAYTGLRLPTLNELYRPFVVFPVTTYANAALKNERLEGYEAGIDFKPVENVSLSLTAFDNRVKDAIANVTLDSVTRQRQNIAAIRAKGIEAHADLSLGAFSVDGSLAWTDAEAQQAGADFDGNRPAQTPRWSASATARYVSPSGWQVAATLRHVGAQYEDDLETDVLPAATTLDAYAEVPLLPGLAIVLRAENLTDETIVTRNQGGSIDLGVPQTIWAGAKFGF